MKISVGKCPLCGQESAIEVDDNVAQRIVAWDLGGRQAYVQDAFPYLPVDVREQLITGTHGPCFDEAFPDE